MECEESLHESLAREDETDHVIEIIESLPVPNDDIEHVENLMNNQLEEAEAGDFQQNRETESRNRRKKKRRKKIALLA